VLHHFLAHFAAPAGLLIAAERPSYARSSDRASRRSPAAHIPCHWRHTKLIIDAVPGRGSGFSVEAPEGVRFLTRSRVFTDEESAELEAAGPPARAA
jgi:hypothetical protein